MLEWGECVDGGLVCDDKCFVLLEFMDEGEVPCGEVLFFDVESDANVVDFLCP